MPARLRFRLAPPVRGLPERLGGVFVLLLLLLPVLVAANRRFRSSLLLIQHGLVKPLRSSNLDVSSGRGRVRADVRLRRRLRSLSEGSMLRASRHRLRLVPFPLCKRRDI